jgi:hypothetical protein
MPELPGKGKNLTGMIKLYSNKDYVTYTGNANQKPRYKSQESRYKSKNRVSLLYCKGIDCPILFLFNEFCISSLFFLTLDSH